MTRAIFLTTVFCSFFLFANGQSGCPGCAVSLPPLPSDTIYLEAAPDGEALLPYDNDISFRMPKTTDPVHDIDPGTPAGLNISKITIIALLNVPPGLSWEPNKFEFDPDNETDGCVKFCGTPLVPGYYEIEVFVTAKVVTIEQSTSFTLPMYIAPSSSTTAGFGMQNNSGCGDVTVSFENLIPSNGVMGYDYMWDFGNGQFSNEENPGDVTYSTPGVYEVNYEAVIDTSGYDLLTVQIVDAGCNDISIPPISNAPPELYIKIKDPSGTQIYTSNTINNAPLPSAFNVNIPIGAGDYTLEVRDDDLIGSDHCGTVTFNRMTNDTLEDGSLLVDLSILHPIFTIQSTDTVEVFEVPAPPVLVPNEDIVVCEGEEVLIVSDINGDLQWYKDSSAILGATDTAYLVNSPGIYWLEFTSADGCQSISDAISFDEIPLPVAPSFAEDANWLELLNPGALPVDYSLQWIINGDSIPDANETSFCNTYPGVNLFTLLVTDNETDCSREFSLGVAFDTNADCTVDTKELIELGASLQIYPNPTSGIAQITFSHSDVFVFEMELFNAPGHVIFRKNYTSQSGQFQDQIDLSELPGGLYFLGISNENGRVTRKLIKED